MEKHKILKVTMVKYYFIPVVDDERTMINRWPMEMVVEDWFEGKNLDAYHASRQAYGIQNSSYAIKVEVVNKIDSSKNKKLFKDRFKIFRKCARIMKNLLTIKE